jgi:hypothetical protein
LAHNRAFLEMHALQVAGNARTNLDCVDSFEAAGELITVADLLANYFGYAYFHRDWGWGLGLSRAGTSGIQASKSRQSDRQH